MNPSLKVIEHPCIVRLIATPGSLKDKAEEAWLSKHYITLSVVAGVVILTSLAAYKLWKQHPAALNSGAQNMASVATKKRDYL